jgi:hypothetical protein
MHTISQSFNCTVEFSSLHSICRTEFWLDLVMSLLSLHWLYKKTFQYGESQSFSVSARLTFGMGSFAVAEGCPVIVRCLSASLASVHWMQEASSSRRFGSKKHLQPLPYILEQGISPLTLTPSQPTSSVPVTLASGIKKFIKTRKWDIKVDINLESQKSLFLSISIHEGYSNRPCSLPICYPFILLQLHSGLIHWSLMW